jgi:hypothetical protein
MPGRHRDLEVSAHLIELRPARQQLVALGEVLVTSIRKGRAT